METFCRCILCVFKIYINFKTLRGISKPYTLSISEIIDSERHDFSEHPFAVTVVTGLKQCLNLRKSILILLLHHSEIIMVQERFPLIISEILGLFVNILFVNENYSRHKRKNLT